tara:strand:+ start:597 stop:773 length:177 start_codon:yes stop_codon:yes gene_type:complete
MNIKTLDGIVSELDYHSMWYKWMTKICPSPKEMHEFKNKNKPDQVIYLKEKLNESNNN